MEYEHDHEHPPSVPKRPSQLAPLHGRPGTGQPAEDRGLTPAEEEQRRATRLYQAQQWGRRFAAQAAAAKAGAAPDSAATEQAAREQAAREQAEAEAVPSADLLRQFNAARRDATKGHGSPRGVAPSSEPAPSPWEERPALAVGEQAMAEAPPAPDGAHQPAHGADVRAAAAPPPQPAPHGAATPSGLAPLVIPSTSRQIEALRARGAGVPLGEALARMMAGGLGVDAADLAPVRLHHDPGAWALAARFGQPVYAEGNDVFFQKGAYQPGTPQGRNLLGRQLARTPAVRAAQHLRAAATAHPAPLDGAREAAPAPAPVAAAPAPVVAASPVTREGATGAATAGPAPPNTTHPLPTFGWVTLGDAHNDGGLNLRPQPSTDAWFKTPQKIADRTKLMVDRRTAQGWAHVTLTDGRSGWVDSQFVDTRWPEPDAQLHRVRAGDSAFSLAHQYYEQDARLIHGIDKRFFVTVLAYVNPHLNIDDLRPNPAEYLWAPSARFAFSLASILSHGTLTGGAWAELSGAWSGAWGAAEGALQTAWTYAEGSVAFDVGLLQGAWDAVWSTVTGLAGLAKLPFEVVWALVRDLLTGTLVGKAGDLWNMVTHLDLGTLLGAARTAVGLALTDVAAKWNDPDVIKRWNVRGFVVGEALVQVLLTVFSGGAFAALKAVSRAGELADLIARVPAVERLVGAAGDLKGAGAEALRGLAAHAWAATAWT